MTMVAHHCLSLWLHHCLPPSSSSRLCTPHPTRAPKSHALCHKFPMSIHLTFLTYQSDHTLRLRCGTSSRTLNTTCWLGLSCRFGPPMHTSQGHWWRTPIQQGCQQGIAFPSLMLLSLHSALPPIWNQSPLLKP